MAGVILETLSNKKLIVFAVVLFLMQIAFFLLGGLIAPSPTNVQQLLANICVDEQRSGAWIYPRGKYGRCSKKYQSIDDEFVKENPLISADDIIFTFQFPLPREDRELEMSRYHQNMLSVLHVVFEANPEANDEKDLRMELSLNVRLGYNDDNTNTEYNWTEIGQSLEKRPIDCVWEQKGSTKELICDMIPLFELGSVHHKFYLINIRIPSQDAVHFRVREIWNYVIHPNGGFTLVWFSMKTFVFPLIAIELCWFIWRLYKLDRKPNLLEQTLIAVGIAITLLNIPIDWLTLWIHMPFMVLYSDIRQGIFYSVLFCFWVIFTGEHVMDQVNRNHVIHYWKQLCAVGFGCICLFVFEMCERGVQLTNPFFSIWSTNVGRNLGLSFVILAGLAAGVYFIYLMVMIVRVFRTIIAKKASLPSMNKARRTFYMGLIYRFSFLMVFTLLCAAMTVILFIVGQVSEGQWKWGDSSKLEYTSAVQTGVYGMWNIYVFCLLILYAPSHKYVPVEADDNSNEDHVEFSTIPSEASVLTAFAQKATND